MSGHVWAEGEFLCVVKLKVPLLTLVKSVIIKYLTLYLSQRQITIENSTRREINVYISRKIASVWWKLWKVELFIVLCAHPLAYTHKTFSFLQSLENIRHHVSLSSVCFSTFIPFFSQFSNDKFWELRVDHNLNGLTHFVRLLCDIVLSSFLVIVMCESKTTRPCEWGMSRISRNFFQLLDNSDICFLFFSTFHSFLEVKSNEWTNELLIFSFIFPFGWMMSTRFELSRRETFFLLFIFTMRTLFDVVDWKYAKKKKKKCMTLRRNRIRMIAVLFFL